MAWHVRHGAEGGHDREDGDDQEELDAGVELLLILKKAVKDLVLLVQMAVLLLRSDGADPLLKGQRSKDI